MFSFIFQIYVYPLYFSFAFQIVVSFLHVRFILLVQIYALNIWFLASAFSLLKPGGTLKRVLGECSCADLALVAILFVRFWGSRNSFRQDICAAKLWGNAEGPRVVSAFKLLYKNPLRYLKGILVRE